MILFLTLLAQSIAGPTTPVAPIVKGTGLPPPAADEAAVLAPVTALLGAIAAHDPDTVARMTLPEGALTVARTDADGKPARRTMRWSEFAAALKPNGERVEERQGMPAIEIDGEVAMVWAPFTFVVDGAPHHCGVNHYDLVRTDAGWRILNVTYSSRTTGCLAQP